MTKAESPAKVTASPNATVLAGIGEWRELVEILLLLLMGNMVVRTFIAEIYWVPTGSMAPTVFGLHKWPVCMDCGYEFAVGVEANDHLPQECACPRCGRRPITINQEPINTGERLLILLGGDHLPYRRWESVVFLAAHEPRRAFLKRIVGLPGETVQISHGDVYINGVIARKSLAQLRRLAVPLYEAPLANPKQPTTESTIAPAGLPTATANTHRTAVDPLPANVLPSFRCGWDRMTLPTTVSSAWHVDPSTQQIWYLGDTATTDWLKHRGWLPSHLTGNYTGSDVSQTEPLEIDRIRFRRLDDDQQPQPLDNRFAYNALDLADGDDPITDMILELKGTVRANADLPATAYLEVSYDVFPAVSFSVRWYPATATVELLQVADTSQTTLLRRARLPALQSALTDFLFFQLTLAYCDGQLWVELAPGPLTWQHSVTATVPPREAAPLVLSPYPWSITVGQRPGPDLTNTPRSASASTQANALTLCWHHISLRRDVYYMSHLGRATSLWGTTEPYLLAANEYFLLGDNSAISQDSRAWEHPGVPHHLLIGRAIGCCWSPRNWTDAGESGLFGQYPDWRRLRWID